VFDALPRLVHSLFVSLAIILLNAQSRGVQRMVFRNVLIHLALFGFAILLLVLEFSITQLRSLSAIRFRLHSSKSLFIVLICAFVVYHSFIWIALVIGLSFIQLPNFQLRLLLIFAMGIPEALEMVSFIIRVCVQNSVLGISMAADIFYVVELNLVSILFLYLRFNPVAFPAP
jgi:hypothetical protein